MKFNIYKSYTTAELIDALEREIDEYTVGASPLKINLIKDEIRERLIRAENKAK